MRRERNRKKGERRERKRKTLSLSLRLAKLACIYFFSFFPSYSFAKQKKNST